MTYTKPDQLVHLAQYELQWLSKVLNRGLSQPCMEMLGLIQGPSPYKSGVLPSSNDHILPSMVYVSSGPLCEAAKCLGLVLHSCYSMG